MKPKLLSAARLSFPLASAIAALLAAPVAQAASLTWDPGSGGTTDGAGTWLTSGLWWDGLTNVDWTDGWDAIIGNGGTGGTITLGAITAGTVLLDNFTGTYELQNGTLTQSGGFTVGTTAGNVTLKTMTLTGTGGLTMNGPGILNTQGSTLSYSGTTTVTGGGTMQLGGNKASGNFTLNNGLLNDYYRATTDFTLGLGAGDNQIQLFGQSGFGAGNGGSTWRIGASKSQLQWGSTYFNPTVLQLQTPASNMGPSIYGQVTLDNGLDLNGAQRTINVLGLGTNPAKSSGTLTGTINDSTATTAGITKTGAGTLILAGPNDGSTYNGSFVIDGGAVIFGSSYQNTWEGESLPSTVNLKINNGVVAGYYHFSRNLGTGAGELQITGGTSGFTMKQGDRYDITLDGGAEVVWGSADFNPSVFVLNLNDLAPSSPARFNNSLDLNGADRTVFTDTTATFSNNTAFGDIIGRGGNLAGDIQNTQGTSAGLVKTGVGAIALSGTNTYDGGTTISEGSLYFTKIAAMPATGDVSVANGATLLVALGGSGEWTTGTSGYGTLGGLLAGDGGQSNSTVTLSATANLGLVVSGTQTYSGVVSSGGNVATYGTGTLVLDQNNTFTGNLIINGGSTLSLTGDNSGASGDVNINNGYFNAGTANLNAGALIFASAGNDPAVWVTSGSVTPTIGSANDVFWSGNGGFAAGSSALTMTLNSGNTLVWNNATTGFNGKVLQLGSATSTAAVELTNNITLNNNYTVRLFDNTSSSADVSILSGDIVRDGANNRNLTVQGSGTLSLTGANNFGTGTLQIDGGAVVRAVDGTGLPTGAKLNFNGGVLESSGTVSRTIANSAGNVYWGNSGGFAANGGALDVNLNGGATLVWGATSGFNGKTLIMGSATADNVVTLQNNITLDNNRTIVVNDNPNTSADVTVLSGDIVRNGTNNWNLTVQGSGTLSLTGANDFGTGQLQIDSGATVRAVDGTGLPTAAKLLFNGGVLESSGTFSRTIANTAGNVYWNNNGGFAANGGALDVNLNAGATIDWNATNGFNAKTLILGSGTANNVVTIENNIDLKNNRTITVNDNPDSAADYAVLSGVIANGDASNRALTKDGTGMLVLTNTNTYTGATTVSGGTLAVNGTGSINGAGSGNVTVNGGTFRYNSSVAYSGALTFTSGAVGGTNLTGSLDNLTIGANQTLSPGNSPGTALTGSQTWAAAGSYAWEINDANGTAGTDPGWDLLSGTGTLTITATSGSEFNLLLTSLTSLNAAGLADNFNDASNYNWLIADFANAVSGFAADAFNIDDTNFTNTYTGTFGVALGNTGTIGGDNTEIYLTYTAVPEPRAALLGGLGLLMLLRRRR